MKKPEHNAPAHVVFERGIRGTDPIITDGLPHVAFVGRSNVGKSSAINRIFGGKTARSSATPGKTREINFYLIEGEYHAVDLPGYGYARTDEKHAEKLRKMILWYLEGKEVKPKLVCHIIDANIGLTDFDREMEVLLAREGHPRVILANKIDKLSGNGRTNVMHALSLSIADLGPVVVIPFSAKTGDGAQQVRELIATALKENANFVDNHTSEV